MASYLITGASRGIGLAFLENISSDPANTVIGLVRNKAGTESKVAALNRSNIHLIQGDLNDYESLKSAVETTTKITGGGLDYLIANAGVASDSPSSNLAPLGELGKDPVALENDLISIFRTNVVGNIHLFNLFIPLILKGNVKKVITLSSGMGDLEVARIYNLHENGRYSISKAALNMAVGKFSAEYSKDGVLFISICPGMVETGQYAELLAEDGAKVMEMVEKFKVYAPHFTGPAQPNDAAIDVLNVAQKASVANGDGGSYVSHFGNKQWI
ncbi:Nn.00g087960.m01.CDS01 [Neocucurbitaria sp. VM-36]